MKSKAELRGASRWRYEIYAEAFAEALADLASDSPLMSPDYLVGYLKGTLYFSSSLPSPELIAGMIDALTVDLEDRITRLRRKRGLSL